MNSQGGNPYGQSYPHTPHQDNQYMDPHIEHRITVLEQEQCHHRTILESHNQKIIKCENYKEDMHSIISKVGWALAVLATSVIIYIGSQAIKQEIWTLRAGNIHDAN